MSEDLLSMSVASLMDLASFDTSDLKAQVGRLQAAGIYIVDMEKAGFVLQPAKDPAEPTNFRLETVGVILAFQPAVPAEYNGNPDEMAGRNLKESVFIAGKDFRESIQQLMGRYKQAGLRHKGAMGGVEGAAPGWVDEIAGKRLVVRVRHYTTAGGEDRVAFDWLSPKQMEKAGFKWGDVMNRDFLDENGNPVEQAA